MIKKRLSDEQMDAVLSAIAIARQIAASVADDKLELCDGWTRLTPEQAGFYNDFQRQKFVALSHPDLDVQMTAMTVLTALRLSEMMMPGLDLMRFVVVIRTDA